MKEVNWRFSGVRDQEEDRMTNKEESETTKEKEGDRRLETLEVPSQSVRREDKHEQRNR